MSSAKRLSETASSSEDMQPASAAVAEADLIPSLWQEPWADNGYPHVVHKSTENRLSVANFSNFGFDVEEYIPPLTLVPSMGMFGSKVLCELSERFEDKPSPVHVEPEGATYGGGTWSITSEPECKESPACRFVADVFAFSDHSRSRVVSLPKLYDQCPTRLLDTFEATFKAFV